MLGLIKKDLLMIRGNIKIVGILAIVFAIMDILEDGKDYILYFLPAAVCIMMITTFSYDEYNKTDAYITTFPCGKKNVVKAKYISTLILIAVVTLISIVFFLGVGLLKNDINLQNYLETSIGVTIGITLVQSIFYPMIYKFGVEKSRIGIFFSTFGIVGVITFLSKSGISLKLPTSIISIFDTYWFIFVPIITIIFVCMSYQLSARIYMKKEF
ncbi:MAG: ABC-2 transporter permease [Bacilli bacterium]|nr:ABC-2 transporter permease [Bacilli bacterium]